MTEKILITAALIYANGPVHVGHLVEYIQTDVYTRFLKLKGHDAIYCCADDTHGTPIEVAALKAGMEPEEFIKRWYDEHKKDFADFSRRWSEFQKRLDVLGIQYARGRDIEPPWFKRLFGLLSIAQPQRKTA